MINATELLASELIADAEDRLTAAKLASAIAAGGSEGATALLQLARLVGETADAATLAERLQTVTAIDVLDTTGLLVAACFGALRQPYPSRQDAVTARKGIAERADAAYRLASELSAELLDWLVRLAGETVQSLSAIAADRAPLVRVETGISLPSSVLAWQMYGDPSRGEEIVDRNRAGTPLVMPVVVEALAE